MESAAFLCQISPFSRSEIHIWQIYRQSSKVPLNQTRQAHTSADESPSPNRHGQDYVIVLLIFSTRLIDYVIVLVSFTRLRTERIVPVAVHLVDLCPRPRPMYSTSSEPHVHYINIQWQHAQTSFYCINYASNSYLKHSVKNLVKSFHFVAFCMSSLATLAAVFCTTLPLSGPTISNGAGGGGAAPARQPQLDQAIYSPHHRHTLRDTAPTQALRLALLASPLSSHVSPRQGLVSLCDKQRR